MISPTQDRVSVRPIEEETTSSSGIITPESAKKKPKKGTILAAGPDVKHLKVGMVVLYADWGPQEVESGGETLLLIKEEDIVAIETKEKK